jgi:pectinesterase
MKLAFLAFLITMFSVSFADADVTVAADGSGDVRTVQEAVDKVPQNNRHRFVIRVKPGIYSEQIRIPANKPYISLIGESPEKTKITYNLSNKAAGSTSAS